MKRIIFFAVTLLLFAACKRNNNMSKIPAISLVSVTPGTVKAGAPEDTIRITFSIEDGDADLGQDTTIQTGAVYDIYILGKNIANGRDTLDLYFPHIPKTLSNPANGIKALCTVDLLAANLQRLDTATTDPEIVQFEVFITDKARHESNRISTGDITLTIP